jgi:hypothetical protein
MLETICASLIGLSCNLIGNSSVPIDQFSASSSQQSQTWLKLNSEKFAIQLAKGKPHESIYRQEADSWNDRDDNYDGDNNYDSEEEIQEEIERRRRETRDYEERNNRIDESSEGRDWIEIDTREQTQEELEQEIEELEERKEELEQRQEELEDRNW